MTILLFTFIHLKLLDFIDILLVALLLYRLYYLIKDTVAINLFIGIALVYVLWLIVKHLEMRLLGGILEKFIDVGFIALIIVFQPEIRRFLLFIGATNFRGISKRIKDFKWQLRNSYQLDISKIVKACENMSIHKTGAIIVITKNNHLDFYVNSGELLNAQLSVKLVESIFFKNSPLHDGALIITDNSLRAARCILPITEKIDFPEELGMRHRAAVGISENSDAITIVVSEQTGEIALSKDGNLNQKLTTTQLKEFLNAEFGSN